MWLAILLTGCVSIGVEHVTSDKAAEYGDQSYSHIKMNSGKEQNQEFKLH